MVHFIIIGSFHLRERERQTGGVGVTRGREDKRRKESMKVNGGWGAEREGSLQPTF